MDNIAEYIQEYCSCLHEWDAAFEDYAKSVGLSYTSLCILDAIYDTDGCTQKQLCSLCFLPRSEAGHILSRLRDCDRIAMGSLTESEREQLLSLTRRYMSACISAMKKL